MPQDYLTSAYCYSSSQTWKILHVLTMACLPPRGLNHFMIKTVACHLSSMIAYIQQILSKFLFLLIPHSIGEVRLIYRITHFAKVLLQKMHRTSKWRVFFKTTILKIVNDTFVCIIRCLFSAIFHNSSRKCQSGWKKKMSHWMPN